MAFRAMSVVMAAGLWTAAMARAQLIGPIPPATPPTPEYVAPEKREVPVVVPPEVEPPAPSIIEKDEQGKLKALKGTAEEAAVGAYKMDAARREKVERVAAARNVDLDRLVVQNLDKVLAARKMREKVESASEFSELFAARDIVVALRYERLIDRLERERAITPAQRVRLDETLLKYEKAREQEIDDAAGGDPTRRGVLNLRQTFADATREVFESLERQMDGVAADFWKIVDGIELRPEQKARVEQLRRESKPGNIDETHSPQEKAKVRRFIDEVFDLEQQRAALTAKLAERPK